VTGFICHTSIVNAMKMNQKNRYLCGSFNECFIKEVLFYNKFKPSDKTDQIYSYSIKINEDKSIILKPFDKEGKPI
jgi:hypothetical protein